MPEPEIHFASVPPQSQNIPEPQPENNKMAKSRMAFRVILIVAIFGLLAYAFAMQKDNIAKKSDGQKLQAYQMNVLPVGREPEGFPSAAILEPKVNIFYSEDSIDSTGQNQKIIMFYSSSTPDSLFKTYGDGLEKQKWSVINKVDQKDVKLLEFRIDNVLRVLITPYGTGSQVRMEYHVSKK